MHMTNSKIPPPPSVKTLSFLILPLSPSGMSRSRMNFRSGRRGPAAYLRRKERMLRISIRRMVKTDTFYLMVLSLVALNTICVAIVHHNQPDWLTIFLCGFLLWMSVLFAIFFFLNQKSEIRSENTFFLAAPCFILLSDFCFPPSLISRLCRVCFPGTVSGWDVFENVWSGFPAVLPLIFQLLRLWGEVLHLLFSLCARIYTFLVLNED